MYFWKLRIKSEYEEIKRVRNEVKKLSLEFGFYNVFQEAIELSIGELITNIIKHGQKFHGKEKGIEVVIKVEGNYFYMDFFYQGDIPKDEKIKKMNEPPKVEDVFDLSEGGRGMYLINHLMDAVNYEKQGELAKVQVVKKIKNIVKKLEIEKK